MTARDPEGFLRAHDSDEQAFTTLVELPYGTMLAVAQGYVRSRAVAEEVVHEAWLGVLQGIDRFLRRLDAWDAGARDEYTRMCADRTHERARTPSLAHWDAVIERSTRWGPALLGFMAARIAEERSGHDAYHAERARQANWLAGRLGLGT